jgi:hypothetical protein
MTLEEAKTKLRSVLGKYQQWELMCEVKKAHTDDDRICIAQEVLDMWPRTGSIGLALAASLQLKSFQEGGMGSFEIPPKDETN